MAITLEQTNKTANSVTFNVDGIVNDRATYVWHVSEGKWYKLQKAKAYDVLYIKDFSTSGGDNGTITVEFLDNRVGLNDYDNETYWYDGDYNFKCWDFVVGNVTSTPPDIITTFTNPPFTDIGYITTTVEFFWDNTPTKQTDWDFDMTLADQIRFQWFALYMYYWIGGIDNSWEIYLDYLYGEDLREAAQKIYNTALNLTSTVLPNRSSVLTDMGRILDFAYRNDKVYVSHLNGIKNAINNFKLRKVGV